jgi:hypothetical protein
MAQRDQFERSVKVSPSRNWIRPEPARNYGVSNCRVFFNVKGPKGAVTFQIGTMWGCEPVRRHLRQFSRSNTAYDQPDVPVAWDLGYHSYTPHYEGQSVTDGDCDVLGGPCYYDGSTLNAEKVVEGFLAGGTDWLWPKLEEYYRCVFEGGEYPDFTPQYLPHPDDEKSAA